MYLFFLCLLFQYYQHARTKALVKVYPDLAPELTEAAVKCLNYPRPISEPPSPSSSRHTTPATSVHGSDDEDEFDEEKEVSDFYVKFFSINLEYKIDLITKKIRLTTLLISLIKIRYFIYVLI